MYRIISFLNFPYHFSLSFSYVCLFFIIVCIIIRVFALSHSTSSAPGYWTQIIMAWRFSYSRKNFLLSSIAYTCSSHYYSPFPLLALFHKQFTREYASLFENRFWSALQGSLEIWFATPTLKLDFHHALNIDNFTYRCI